MATKNNNEPLPFNTGQPDWVRTLRTFLDVRAPAASGTPVPTEGQLWPRGNVG